MPTPNKDTRRQGGVLLLVLLVVVIFMMMAAFSVDVAYMQLTRTELRSVTDAAARAATSTLAREQDTGKAIDAAKYIAKMNRVAGKEMLLETSDLTFGNATLSETSLGQFSPYVFPYNAVKVDAARTSGSLSGSVPLIFASLFGVNEFQPTQTAIAVNLDRDISLVLDHSGSMDSIGRWPALRGAVDVFLRELENMPQVEHVALVGYSDNATLVQGLTPDLNAIRTAFDLMSPGGYTAIGAGLLKGSDSLVNGRPFASKTIIVMTDGIHNTGTGPDVTVLTAIARGHIVHTVSFGDGANQTLMQQVATAGGGLHLHAPDNNALRAAFRQLAGTLPVVLAR